MKTLLITFSTIFLMVPSFLAQQGGVLKTPGVYVEEHQNQNRYATIESIPAFIGNTFTYPMGRPFEPVKINSLAEYERFFGTNKLYQYEVRVTQNAGNNQFEIVDLGKDVEAEKQVMYYAISLYFTNGGTPCYIVPLPNNEDQNTLNLKNGSATYLKGLEAVSKIDEVTLLVLPDAAYLSTGYDLVCQAALDQCAALEDRFAILDIPMNDDLALATQNFRDRLSGNLMYGAAYTPFLNSSLNYSYDESHVTVTFEGNQTVSKTGSNQLSALQESHKDIYDLVKIALKEHTVTLPPSSAVAGIYMKTDAERGIWKAPANVAMEGVEGPTYQISASENEELNVDPVSGKSINAIRSFTDKGTLVWGARTLAGNDYDWRYVSVRRLLIQIEETAKKTMKSYEFAPNEAATWSMVKQSITNYLENLWRSGGLQGARPEDAYSVRIGLGDTMTGQDILDGKMVLDILVSPVRPGEYIMTRVVQKFD